MEAMTSIERISNILQRKPVDRIGVFEHFWGDTRKQWTEDGYITADQDLDEHFDFDMRNFGPCNMKADIDFEPEILEETEETKLVLDGNGAKLRWHKLHDGTPEHIDFAVKKREQWEELIKPLLTPDPRRINFEGYREARQGAAEKNRFFCWAAAHVFEIMKEVAGHEYMLIGMIDDPDWVKDMVMTYSRLFVDLQEMLFAQEGPPDGIWYYEDMGYKLKPFMSPQMYNEIVQPGHALTFEYAKSRGLPVIVHSCGYVEQLIPGLITAGMDCLQVIEVKAGMDLVKLYREFGEDLSFMGGIDVRVLYSNDIAKIDAELEAKIPVVKGHYGYVLHSDHSIPNTVSYPSYNHFVDRGRELGSYNGI